MVAARCRPSVGLARARLAIAARIALVAFSRARSAWEAARRSRPISPTARAAHAGHHVDDRLGGKPGHRRAADVFQPHDHRTDGGQELGPGRLELVGPGGVVGHHDRHGAMMSPGGPHGPSDVTEDANLLRVRFLPLTGSCCLPWLWA